MPGPHLAPCAAAPPPSPACASVPSRNQLASQPPGPPSSSAARSWAVTYARQGIRANVICPGLVLTPMVMRVGDEFLNQATAMTPLGRGAQPSEIGDLVLFLGSDESSFMTGAIIPIDGGLTAI